MTALPADDAVTASPVKTPCVAEPHTGEGVARLSHLRLIRATGEDAVSFLQGQLTQDVQALTPGEFADVRLAGFCSAKGRLQASFVIWRPEPQAVNLLCAADVAEAVCKRLSMFVLRARCRLRVDADTAVWGLIGEAAVRNALGALDALSASGRGDRRPAVWTRVSQPQPTDGTSPAAEPAPVPSPECLLWPEDGQGLPRALWLAPATSPAPTGPDLDVNIWKAGDVRAGLPWIEAGTFERFVPQMINLELLGGVNFRKGCYPGQEVVARSQYRGTLKRRMGLFQTEGLDGAVPSAGQEVYAADDAEQPVGLVVNAAPVAGGGALALVELQIHAWDRTDLRVGSATGAPLHRRGLPYPVPLEAVDP